MDLGHFPSNLDDRSDSFVAERAKAPLEDVMQVSARHILLGYEE